MGQLIKQEQLDVLRVSQQELIEKFNTQLLKDFEMSDVAAYLEPIVVFEYDEIHSNIMNALKKIDNKDFSKYQHLLYRIDISEKTVELELKSKPDSERYAILADLIIKRILQKVILKIQFSKK
jgi:hypothetical protein